MNFKEELLEVEATVNFKPCKKVMELKRNEKYSIKRLKRCVTKYGERIVADLGEFEIFLPMRYSKLTDAAVSEVNKGSYTLEYLHPLGQTFKLIIEEQL